MSTQSTLIGKVTGLYRYPVKAMASESLLNAEVSWFGIAGDRRWAFVRDAATGSGFPWLTIRQRNDLAQYRPTFIDPAQPDQSAVQIQTPAGKKLNITDAQLAAELSAELFPDSIQPGVHAIKQNRGIFDTFPLSLITTQTIGQLGESIGCELDARRFRPNLLVDATDDAEFPEDQWVSRVLRIGTMKMRIDKRDSRCAVINIDPQTSQSNPGILKAVVNDRDGCLGVYATPVQPGRIAVNDGVYLEG